MTLGNAFQKKAKILLDETAKMYINAAMTDRIHEAWQVKRPGDFMCGFFAGQMFSSLVTMYAVQYKKEPDGEAQREIIGMLEEYADMLVRHFARHNESLRKD